MQQSKASSSSRQTDTAATAERKRKLTEQPPSGADGSALANKLRRTSNTLAAPEATGIEDSPKTKRQKTVNISSPTGPPPPETPLRGQKAALPPEKMYNFSTPKMARGNMVDLTASPSPTSSPNKSALAQKSRGLNAQNGTRKLLVKNLRVGTGKTDTVAYLNQVWGQLDAALNAIFADEKVTYSMEELYKGVENVCRQGHAAEMFKKLYGKCEGHVRNAMVASLLDKAAQEDVDVLKAVILAWDKWNAQLITIRRIFFYLNQSYLLPSQRPSLQEMAVELFRTQIFNNARLNSKIIGGACDMITADRTNQSLDQTVFRQAIKMFHDLGTYTKAFEPMMLEKSQSYVIFWAKSKMQNSTLSDYVTACDELIKREMERCQLFGLDQSTSRDLLALLEVHCIVRQASFLTADYDVQELLRHNEVESLERLYLLLQRKELGVKLKEPFGTWVEDTGTSIVFDEKEQDQMVVRLLSLKRSLDTIWRVSFRRHDELGHILRERFEVFMNKTKKSSGTWGTDNSKPGEMIAKYVDMLLRGGARAIPSSLAATPSKKVAEDEEEEFAIDEDTEVNNQLDQVLDLFRFVHGKAVFEAFYKKDLARRLLMGKSASADAERSMLTRLKTECGAAFTQNLEQMFKDIELGREEMASYKAWLEDRGDRPKVDLHVSILSSAAWPTYPNIPVVVPADIKSSLDIFERHYKSKHSGRKLEWKHALAQCQMKADFPKGRKEFVVSSFQAIVLLLFNGLGAKEHLTYEFINAETGLPEAEVKRTLQSLACAKLRPLTKHPKGRDINDTDTFTINLDFSHEKIKVKINQIQLKETKEENKETHERVAADRNFETQAAIVRIMKSRKTISHPELVSEVINATKARGVLSMADIKKNIDRLIEKDYMEREEDGKYSYVA